MSQPAEKSTLTHPPDVRKDGYINITPDTFAGGALRKLFMEGISRIAKSYGDPLLPKDGKRRMIITIDFHNTNPDEVRSLETAVALDLKTPMPKPTGGTIIVNPRTMEMLEPPAVGDLFNTSNIKPIQPNPGE